MRRIRYGRRPCPDCGALITTNALGRSAHNRSYECERALIWKELGTVLFKAKRNAEFEDEAVRLVRNLVHWAPKKFKGGGR